MRPNHPADEIDLEVDRIVAQAPTLTPEQQARLRGLFDQPCAEIGKLRKGAA